MTDRPLLLAGLRVLECTATVAGAYCGKLLADLGADVVKLEPPAGDPARRRGPFPNDLPHPERSGRFLYLNTNKHGHVLNIAAPDATAALAPWLRWADLLIEDFQAGVPRPPALTDRCVRAANPKLVCVSVTHFGQSGPYAGWYGSELVDFQMSGLGYLTPGNVADAAEPPLKAPGCMSEQLGGLSAAVAALGALAWAEQSREGVSVDVSVLEASVAQMLLNVPWLTYEGVVPSRMRAGRRGTPIEPLPCADGYFFLLTVEAAQWDAWVEVMGSPAWATDPALRDRGVRAERWDEIRLGIIAWASDRGKQEIAALGQARRVPVFPVNTVDDLFRCPQLAARDFLTPIVHPATGTLRYPGLPYRIDGPPTAPWRPAPRLGEHSDHLLATEAQTPRTRSHRAKGARPGPLAGVRVADFSWVLAGPHCTAWLGALGADVIRVETRRRLDQFRRSAPYGDGIVDPDRAGSFHAINFGKRGITLDLTQPEAVAYARELIAVSDVVVENFAFGQMERFGLDLDTIRGIRPDVIFASSSGVGRTGPYREYVAYGTTIHAYAGLTGLVGHRGGPPLGLSATYTDPLTGATQCFAILAALRYRERTGCGCTIDLSMAEATMALLPEPLLDYAMNGRAATPAGNDDACSAPQGVYSCRAEGSAEHERDRWVAISVTSEAAWAAFCRTLGRDDWLRDPRFADAAGRRNHHALLDAEIAAWTCERTAGAVARLLQDVGVAAGPSATVADLLADPHLAARGTFVAPPHPLTGARRIPGPPWRITPEPGVPLRPAPVLGQHTDEVLMDLLGLTAERVDDLVAQKVVF